MRYKRVDVEYFAIGHRGELFRQHLALLHKYLHKVVQDFEVERRRYQLSVFVPFRTWNTNTLVNYVGIFVIMGIMDLYPVMNISNFIYLAENVSGVDRRVQIKGNNLLHPDTVFTT